MTSNRHVFNKMNFWVDTTDEVTAKYIYSLMGNYVNDELLPLLENKLDSYQLENHFYITNSLQIELDGVTRENFREKLTQRILDEFDKLFLLNEPDNKGIQHHLQSDSQVLAYNKASNIVEVPNLDEGNYIKQYQTNHAILFLLVHFLETGKLPWWGTNLKASFTEKYILSAIREDILFFAQLISTTPVTDTWIQRLKAQFSVEFSINLLQILRVEFIKYKQIIDIHAFYYTIGRIAKELQLFKRLVNSNMYETEFNKYENGVISFVELTHFLFNLEGAALNPQNLDEENSVLHFFDILLNRSYPEKTGIFLHRGLENKLIGLSDINHSQVYKRFIKVFLVDHTILLKLESHFTSQFLYWFYKSLYKYIITLHPSDNISVGVTELIHHLISSSVLFKSIINKIPGFVELFPEHYPSEINMNEVSANTDPVLLPDSNSLEIDYFKEVSKDGKNEIFITNAGLVLLNPFLVYFFKEFRLTENDEFINREARATAVHLLHFLAAREEQAYEYDLIFEKYLCGWPLQEPMDRNNELSDKMKEEADVLLLACIKHWTVLKSTSPDGLREAFLQRKGKLEIAGELHRLVMDTNSIDILLRHLPWNISLIRLPWMKQILHVSWSSN